MSSTGAVIEPANSAEIAPIIVTAFGLRPREQGDHQGGHARLATAEVAEALHRSASTVRDSLKRIFRERGRLQPR